jgi:hypothetical protein
MPVKIYNIKIMSLCRHFYGSGLGGGYGMLWLNKAISEGSKVVDLSVGDSNLALLEDLYSQTGSKAEPEN